MVKYTCKSVRVHREFTYKHFKGVDKCMFMRYDFAEQSRAEQSRAEQSRAEQRITASYIKLIIH